MPWVLPGCFTSMRRERWRCVRATLGRNARTAGSIAVIDCLLGVLLMARRWALHWPTDARRMRTVDSIAATTSRGRTRAPCQGRRPTSSSKCVYSVLKSRSKNDRGARDCWWGKDYKPGTVTIMGQTSHDAQRTGNSMVILKTGDGVKVRVALRWELQSQAPSQQWLV